MSAKTDFVKSCCLLVTCPAVSENFYTDKHAEYARQATDTVIQIWVLSKFLYPPEADRIKNATRNSYSAW